MATLLNEHPPPPSTPSWWQNGLAEHGALPDRTLAWYAAEELASGLAPADGILVSEEDPQSTTAKGQEFLTPPAEPVLSFLMDEPQVEIEPLRPLNDSANLDRLCSAGPLWEAMSEQRDAWKKVATSLAEAVRAMALRPVPAPAVPALGPPAERSEPPAPAPPPAATPLIWSQDWDVQSQSEAWGETVWFGIQDIPAVKELEVLESAALRPMHSLPPAAGPEPAGSSLPADASLPGAGHPTADACFFDTESHPVAPHAAPSPPQEAQVQCEILAPLPEAPIASFEAPFQLLETPAPAPIPGGYAAEHRPFHSEIIPKPAPVADSVTPSARVLLGQEPHPSFGGPGNVAEHPAESPSSFITTSRRVIPLAPLDVDDVDDLDQPPRRGRRRLMALLVLLLGAATFLHLSTRGAVWTSGQWREWLNLETPSTQQTAPPIGVSIARPEDGVAATPAIQ